MSVESISPPIAPSASAHKPPISNISDRAGELEFANVSVKFGAFTAMGPTSLKVAKGEFVAIVGPSGCGKSTLLNLAAGTLKPYQGKAFYNGVEVTGPNRDVGYITQKNYCLPWRTVEANVMLPLEFRPYDEAERKRRCADAIRRVGLSGFEGAYPRQLSGGMLQRVMIARTLAYSPTTYLMDEPFGSLDAQLRLRMHADLMSIRRETGATFVFVTHDLQEAITLADRVVVMSHRPGKMKLELPIELPAERDVVRIQSHPRYGEYFDVLWNALEVRA